MNFHASYSSGSHFVEVKLMLIKLFTNKSLDYTYLLVCCWYLKNHRVYFLVPDDFIDSLNFPYAGVLLFSRSQNRC